MRVLIFIILLSSVFSDVGYNYKFGGNNEDNLRTILTKPNGDIYLIGDTWSFTTHDPSDWYYDSWITRLDKDTNIIWSRMFGAPGLDSDDWVRGADFHSDGDIIIIGSSQNFATITKINNGDGSIEWSRKLSTNGMDTAGIAVKPSTGEFVVVGDYYVDTNYKRKIFMWKFSSTGILQYTRYFGPYNYYQYPRYVNAAKAGNSHFITFGRADGHYGDFDVGFVACWDYNLNNRWYAYFGTSSSYEEVSTALEIDDDTGLIVVWEDGNDCHYIQRFQTSPSTSIIWKRKFCVVGGNGYMYFYDIVELKHSFLIVGECSINNWGGCSLEIRKDTGSLISASKYTEVSIFYSVVTENGTVEGQPILTGNTYSGGNDNGVLVKLDTNQNTCHQEDITEDIYEASSGYYYTFTGIGYWSFGTGYSSGVYSLSGPSVPSKTIACVGCYGVDNDNDAVCSGHGICQTWDSCSCNPLYPGDNCEKWSCWSISSIEVSNVCGNNITGKHYGICTDINECFCIPGYHALEEYKECTEWYCDGINKQDLVNVCNGRGECTSSESCTCRDEYEGQYCEEFSCGANYKMTEATCSGHGKCISPSNCECSFGFGGKTCSLNLMYFTVMTPVLTISSFGALGVMLCLICCVICVCICFVIAVIVGGIGICLSCGIVFLQKGKMKKFGKLKNIDILIREQELEDDETVAHLTINKNLFEIPYDQITLVSIIGEGGSTSVVYKATWRKRIVAFKCFKTRQVCGDQNSFDEFESEVKILSSISHPNIIRFFGGSLQPPRVGIVMEFCANGDLVAFLKNFKKENDDEKYPLEEKVRMLHEIASALEYLHSRKILHRDLKLENVLVDTNENCKLMDFGLSKIVERVSRAQTKQIGTNIYMSPEIVNSGHYDEKTDVFSFGILMFILITENFNPYGIDERVIEIRVSQNPDFRPNIEEVEDEINKGDIWMIKLITCCWNHEPKIRKTFTELLEIIEERTVVDDAMFDFGGEDSDTSATLRSDSDSSFIKRRKKEDGDTVPFEEHEIVQVQNIKLRKEYNGSRKKNLVMRRRLFVVQKEKERLVRLLKRKGIYYTVAPAAPGRDSKQGIKPEIKRELAKGRKGNLTRKPAPPPPLSKQIKKINRSSSSIQKPKNLKIKKREEEEEEEEHVQTPFPGRNKGIDSNIFGGFNNNNKKQSPPKRPPPQPSLIGNKRQDSLLKKSFSPSPRSKINTPSIPKRDISPPQKKILFSKKKEEEEENNHHGRLPPSIPIRRASQPPSINPRRNIINNKPPSIPIRRGSQPPSIPFRSGGDVGVGNNNRGSPPSIPKRGTGGPPSISKRGTGGPPSIPKRGRKGSDYLY